MSYSYYFRRRLLLVCAALAYAAVTTSSSQQAAATTHTALSTTALSSSRPSSSHINDYQSSSDDEESTPMVPTFSCGSHWKSATQCNQLCVDGSDASCPIGQHCYAGIPCSKSSVEKSALQMEEELMERLIWERDNQSGAKGFVCGATFQEAESSCGSSGGSGPIHYCNSGQSSECPSNMECFASVACSSSGTGSTSSPSSFSSVASLSSAPKEQPVVSFSSPTANVTPILHQEDDDASFSYYSLHNIVGTMGSKLITSLGALSHSEC